MSSEQKLCEVPLAMPFTAVSREEPRWYAIQTRARHEKIVTKQLQYKGFGTFLPLISQTNRWSDRQKTIQLPLFPCYTFVHVGACPEIHLAELHTSGVIGFVGIRGVGLPIPDKEIEDIETLLTHNITCALYPFLRVGQRVRICGGSLEGVEGILVAKNSDRSLVVSMEVIQRSVAVRIDGYDVEMI